MILTKLNINDIDLGTRARIDYGEIERLVQDIKDNELIQPISVLEKAKVTQLSDEYGDLDPSKPYLLLGGGRRLEACRRLELTEIPARVYDKNLDPDEVKVIELHENLFRKDMEWSEEVKLKAEIHRLQVKKYGVKLSNRKGSEGHSAADTAQMLGESQATISRDLRLAEALEAVPLLSKAKTKSEAIKMIDNVSKNIDAHKSLQTINEKLANSTEDQLKKELMRRYVVGSFFDKAKKLQDASFDFIELDPPYGVEFDTLKKEGELKSPDFKDWTPEQYRANLGKIASECFRLLKQDRWLVLWFAIDPFYEETVKAFEGAGFTVKRLPFVWVKTAGVYNASPNYNLSSSYESCLYMRKGSPTVYKTGGINSMVHPTLPPKQRIHPTEKPFAIMKFLIETFSPAGGTVLVPFAGSGITLATSFALQRSPIGYDISQDFKNQFDLRVANNDFQGVKVL